MWEFREAQVPCFYIHVNETFKYEVHIHILKEKILSYCFVGIYMNTILLIKTKITQ